MCLTLLQKLSFTVQMKKIHFCNIPTIKFYNYKNILRVSSMVRFHLKKLTMVQNVNPSHELMKRERCTPRRNLYYQNNLYQFSPPKKEKHQYKNRHFIFLMLNYSVKIMLVKLCMKLWTEEVTRKNNKCKQYYPKRLVAEFATEIQ